MKKSSLAVSIAALGLALSTSTVYANELKTEISAGQTRQVLVSDLLRPNLVSMKVDQKDIDEYITRYQEGEDRDRLQIAASVTSFKSEVYENVLLDEVNVALDAYEQSKDAGILDKVQIQLDNVEIADTSKVEARIKLYRDQIESEKKAAEEKAAQEAKRAEEARQAQAATEAASASSSAAGNGTPYFGGDGLLAMTGSANAQQAVNLLLGIPGHANGKWYHLNTGLDDLINSLTVEEATWVIHRIEGPGFGQTGDGWAGVDSTASHQTFLNNQVHRRFGGSVHELLRNWGTYSYGGY